VRKVVEFTRKSPFPVLFKI